MRPGAFARAARPRGGRRPAGAAAAAEATSRDRPAAGASRRRDAVRARRRAEAAIPSWATPVAARRRGARTAGAVRACAAAAMLWAPGPAAQAQGEAAPPEPEGYRMQDYRGPVPATLAGARVIATEQARALWEEGEAVFVDVLPRPPRPEGLPEGTIWRPAPREDIPGSVWLPDTGYGALSPEAAAYLAEGLRRASGGDPEAPLVFYCKAECWMSWNAAKRAREALGYGAVAWYPDGTDGWAAAGLPLEAREPEPGAPRR